MRDFSPHYYIFMRDFLPHHYIFMRDFPHLGAVKATDAKSGCMCQRRHATASLYCLLLLSEQAHFYLVRLILLFTFTASATAAQQIAKINPKIIIILILSFLIVILLVFFCVSHLFAPQRNSAFSTCYFLRLILLFTFTASARAAQQIAKIKLKITIMLPFLSLILTLLSLITLLFLAFRQPSAALPAQPRRLFLMQR